MPIEAEGREDIDISSTRRWPEASADFLRSTHATDPAIVKVFAEIPRNKSISLIVQTSWRLLEVERYAQSKFQPPTTLGDPQNVEKPLRRTICLEVQTHMESVTH